ncbi:MAG: efflux transporter periplasmic adaptor subunit, partial [Glaciecola sp.]
MKALRSAGIPLIIVIVAIVVAVVLTLNKPKPEKKELVEKTFLVEVQPVSISDVTYTVTTQGNVMAKVESALSAQ